MQSNTRDIYDGYRRYTSIIIIITITSVIAVSRRLQRLDESANETIENETSKPKLRYVFWSVSFVITPIQIIVCLPKKPEILYRKSYVTK